MCIAMTLFYAITDKISDLYDNAIFLRIVNVAVRSSLTSSHTNYNTKVVGSSMGNLLIISIY